MRLLVAAAVLTLAAPVSAESPGEKPDPANGWRLAVKLTGPTKPITAVAVGPGWIAAGTEDGALTVWDAKTHLPRPLAFPPPKGDLIRELRAGPDSKSLYVIEGKNTVVRYTLGGDRPGEKRTQLAGKVMSGGPDFKAWVVDTGEVVEVVTADLAAHPVVVNRQGAYGHRAWIVERERDLRERDRDRWRVGPLLSSSSVPPDGIGLITVTPDFGVTFWDKPDHLEYMTVSGTWLVAATFTPDSHYLITAGYRYHDDLLEWPDGVKQRDDLSVATRRRSEQRDAIWVQKHQMGGLLLGWWNVPVDSARVLAVDPHGRLLATAGRDGIVRFYSIAHLAAIQGMNQNQLPWLPANQRTATDPPLAELRGHAGPVRCLVFDPTGKRLVSAGDDKTVRVWERP